MVGPMSAVRRTERLLMILSSPVLCCAGMGGT